jgi:hypothetical protein
MQIPSRQRKVTDIVEFFGRQGRHTFLPYHPFSQVIKESDNANAMGLSVQRGRTG